MGDSEVPAKRSQSSDSLGVSATTTPATSAWPDVILCLGIVGASTLALLFGKLPVEAYTLVLTALGAPTDVITRLVQRLKASANKETGK